MILDLGGCCEDAATITAQGADTVTAMGNRNLSLVAGAVAYIPSLSGSQTAGLAQLSLALPEPESGALLAGVVALLAIAVWRARGVA